MMQIWKSMLLVPVKPEALVCKVPLAGHACHDRMAAW